MQKSIFIFFSFLILLLSACTEDSSFLNAEDDFQPQMENLNNLKRTCASHEHTEKLLKDPEYKANAEKRIAAFKSMQKKGLEKALCTTPTVIPVAIHYQGVSNPDNSCLVELAKRQIAALNADFQGKNSDITKWTGNAASAFPGISFGETCVKFCIADQNHPSGYGLSNGSPAVTINATQGDQVNKWSGYLNIFVQFNTGALGYAPLGGAGNGDGVVIDASTFGVNLTCGSVSAEAPYNLGRTTTHEVGHYLLLDHIWGDGCSIDDDVNDTPQQASDNSGCPSIGIKSCGSADLHMNYMDYTNDGCMYMFTNGQAQRMENYLNSSLRNLVDNAGRVCSEASQNDNGGDDGNGDDGNDNGDGDDTDPPVQCEKPTSIAGNNITATTADITWSASSDAIRYQFRYRVLGGSWTRVNTENTSLTIDNLQPNTEYQYRIRTRCDYGWTANTPIATFTTSTENDGGDDGDDDGNTGTSGKVKVEITLDDFGSETTWYIVDGSDFIIAQGGPYRDGISGRTKTKEVTLSDGCYTFIIDDFYGDGICCEFGNGSARIIDANGQNIVESDGRFGYYDEHGFCMNAGSSRLGKNKRDVKRKRAGSKK